MIEEARTSGATVHFASLMDMSFENAELEAKHQKYKGRVVLRGDMVKKNDSRSYGVFTEQRSSASQMTAAKVMDIISRFAWSRWTSCRRSVGLYPSKNGKCSQIMKKSKIGVSRHLDSSTTTQVAKMVQYGRPNCSS